MDSKVGIDFPTTSKLVPQLYTFPLIWGSKTWNNKNWNFYCQKWLTTVVIFSRSTTFSGKVVCPYVYHAGKCVQLSNSMHISVFYNNSSAPSINSYAHYVSYVSCCISKTAASICMCDLPLERVLDGTRRSKSWRIYFAQRRNKPAASASSHCEIALILHMQVVFIICYCQLTVLIIHYQAPWTARYTACFNALLPEWTTGASLCG